MIVVVGRVRTDAGRRDKLVRIGRDVAEAPRRHVATAHLRAFMRTIPGALAAPHDATFYTVASTMDLEDVR